MKEHPKIFSAPMVQAILEGRKTSTRRVLLPAPEYNSQTDSWTWKAKGRRIEFVNGLYLPVIPDLIRYTVGDHLWVKEAWALSRDGTRPIYKANYVFVDDKAFADLGMPWRNPMFMPRMFSRITLVITALHVQRLQEITREEARAEGITEYLHQFTDAPYSESEADVWRNRTTVENFRAFWDCPHSKKSRHKFMWDNNPWVLVTEFKRITKD